MTKFALVIDGTIDTIYLRDPQVKKLVLTPVPDNVFPGWVLTNGTWVPPPPPILTLSQAKEVKTAALADLRWKAEMAGTTFNGIPVTTDSPSRTNVLGAVIAAQINPSYTVKWKTSAGFVELDATAVLAVSQAMRAHIQECFDNEAELAAMIEAADDQTALSAININAGWPAS